MTLKAQTRFQDSRPGLRVSRTGMARLLMLATMVCFASALLRNEIVATLFEILKLPMLAATTVYLFYLRPVIRFSTAALLMWSFVVLVAVSSVYNSLDSSALLPSIAVFVAIGIYFQAVNNLPNPQSILFPVIRWFSTGVVVTSALFIVLPASFIGGRFAAGFINTNVASGFLAIAVVTLSHSVIFERPRPLPILVLGAAVLFLLLTKGRGSLIAAAVPVLIMLMSNWRQSSKGVNFKRLIAIAAVLLLSMKLQIGNTTDATQLDALNFRAFELGARELIIQRHFSAFWHSPFIGAGAVIDAMAPYGRTSGESSYTDLLALSGGIGILLIGILILRALWLHWRRSENSLGFSVLLAALLLASSEGYFVSIASAVSMMLWGLLAVPARRSAPE